MTRVATCRRDGAPLALTLAFRGFEFYCLDCGATYGWLEPRPADETPELLARTEAVKAEFAELSAGLIGEGARLQDCAQCESLPHAAHATSAEWDAHEAAQRRLDARLVRR